MGSPYARGELATNTAPIPNVVDPLKPRANRIVGVGGTVQPEMALKLINELLTLHVLFALFLLIDHGHRDQPWIWHAARPT